MEHCLQDGKEASINNIRSTNMIIKSAKKAFTFFLLLLLIFLAVNAVAKEAIIYNDRLPTETMFAQNKQSKQALKDNEYLKIANSYFEKQAIIDLCVKSAIVEGMSNGYHGTFSKAMYFDAESSV